MPFRDRLIVKPVDEPTRSLNNLPSHCFRTLISRIAVEKAQNQLSDALVFHMLHTGFKI
jgi:hypothetical protein